MSEFPNFAGATYLPIQRERTVAMRRLQLCSLWHSRMKHSEQDSWNIRRRLPFLYDAYRGWRQGDHPYRNDVQLGTLFAMVEADVAKKWRAWNGGPAVQFEGSGAQNSSLIARKQ